MSAGTTSVRSDRSREPAGSPSGLSSLAARFEPQAYALLRVVAGSLFICHGLQKLFGWLGGRPLPVGSQLWFGGLIEAVAGGLIAVGLFARGAAFLASGTMAVAYLQFHWKFAFANSAWLPIVNKGELAVLYCFLFLFIVCRGSGPFSIDSARRAAR